MQKIIISGKCIRKKEIDNSSANYDRFQFTIKSPGKKGDVNFSCSVFGFNATFFFSEIIVEAEYIITGIPNTYVYEEKAYMGINVETVERIFRDPDAALESEGIGALPEKTPMGTRPKTLKEVRNISISNNPNVEDLPF